MVTANDLLLVLGNKNLSSWSLRAWILLRHAGIEFRECVLPLDTPGSQAAIAALSPSRRVPALHHAELVVCDSLAICEYVAELYPEARLWPEDRAARAIARSVSAEMHSSFASMRGELPMDVVSRFPRTVKSAEAEEDIRRVLAIWTECRTRAVTATGDDAGPFLFGRFSVADAMFAPVIWRFRTYDVAIEGPAARAYYKTMLALPAMQEWERDAEAEVKTTVETPGAKSSRPSTAAPRSSPPCYAVIFASKRTGATPEAYEEAARAMVELAANQPGFLGIDSARDADGHGITVSYWESLEAIRAWKAVPAHAAQQARGKESFYERYKVRVCRVERGYEYPS